MKKIRIEYFQYIGVIQCLEIKWTIGNQSYYIKAKQLLKEFKASRETTKDVFFYISTLIQVTQ